MKTERAYWSALSNKPAFCQDNNMSLPFAPVCSDNFHRDHVKKTVSNALAGSTTNTCTEDVDKLFTYKHTMKP